MAISYQYLMYDAIIDKGVLYIGIHACKVHSCVRLLSYNHTLMSNAWIACNRLLKIWKSSLTGHHKRKFFRAVVESVLSYREET